MYLWYATVQCTRKPPKRTKNHKKSCKPASDPYGEWLLKHPLSPSSSEAPSSVNARAIIAAPYPLQAQKIKTALPQSGSTTSSGSLS